MDQPIALVLSGGGVRGIASFGVLQALKEHNIPIDIIAGTSAGAIVSSAFAWKQNVQETQELLQPLFKIGFNNFPLSSLAYPLVSITNGRLLTETLQDIFADLNAEDLWLPNFSIACNLSMGIELEQRTGNLATNIRCSTSLPLIYPPVVVEDEFYVDGGLLNNLPVDKMREITGKNSFIFAVNVSSTTSNQTVYNLPSITAFTKNLLTHTKLANQGIKLPSLIETFLNALMVGSAAKTCKNAQLADLLIQPNLDQFPILGLQPNEVDQLIRIGYLTAKEALNTLSEAQWKQLIL